jgi:hypothetical protein
MRSRSSLSTLGALLATALLSAGCGDRLEAHLGKFLDPTAEREAPLPPPPDAFALGEAPEVADRVQQIPAREAVARLGAHRLQLKTGFRMQRGSHQAELAESALLIQAADGSFRLKVENQAGQGYEMLLSGPQLFVRGRWAKFHPRDQIEAQHLTWRDQALQGWAAIYRLFRGRIAFAKQGLQRHHGRDAVRYGLSLAAGPARLPGAPEPARPPEGVRGYLYPTQPTPTDEARWRDEAAPEEAQGSLLVDSDTGVLLQVDFRGRLGWKDPEGEPVRLEVTASLLADGFGNPASLPPPAGEEVEPLPTRLMTDTKPLDFYFGKGYTSSLGAPAGVARKSADEKQAEAEAPPPPQAPEPEPEP